MKLGTPQGEGFAIEKASKVSDNKKPPRKRKFLGGTKRRKNGHSIRTACKWGGKTEPEKDGKRTWQKGYENQNGKEVGIGNRGASFLTCSSLQQARWRG